MPMPAMPMPAMRFGLPCRQTAGREHHRPIALLLALAPLGSACAGVSMSKDASTSLAAMHPAISARGVSRRVDPEVVLEQDRLRRSNLRTVRFSFATAAYSLFLLHIVLYTFADFPKKGLDTTLAAVPFGAVVAAPALVLAGPVRTCVACLSCTLLGCILGVAFAAAALTGYDSTTLAVCLDFARSLGGTGVGSLYTMVAIESVALINQRESIVHAAAVTLTMQALGSFMAVGGGQMLGDRVPRTTAGLILLILGCLASLSLIVRRLQTPHPMLAYYRTFSTHSALRTVLPVAALAWRGTLVTGVPWLLYDFCFYTLNSMLSSSLRSVSAQGSTASTSFGNAAASTIVFSAFTAAAYAGSIAMARYVNSLGTCVRLQTGGFLAMAVAFGVVWAIVGATSSGATIALALIVPYAICALIVNVTTFALASAWATLAEPASIPVFAFAAALGKVGAIVGSVVLNAVGLHGPPSAWTTTAHSDMLLTFALVSAAGAAATEALWRFVAAERMGWHIFAPVSKASLEGRSPARDLEQSLLATADEKESEPMGAFVSQRWWIPDMMLQLEDKLDAGGSGQVYRARLQGIGVAAKEVFEATLSDGAELRTLVAELEALRTLHHPGLVTLYGVCAMEGFSAGSARYMIVMELMPLSLRRALAAVREPGAQDERAALVAVGTLARAVDTARQIAAAVSFMHAKGWVHCDLKPDNILLSGDGASTKLCDFGIAQLQARVGEEVEEGGGVAGTWAYMPPEALTAIGGINRFAWDVYSFGVNLWELCAAEELYSGVSERDIARRVVAGSLRPPTRGEEAPARLREAPPAVLDLMERCWAEEPAARPRMDEVVRVLGEARAALQ